MDLYSSMRRRRLRASRCAAAAALFLVLGTGFVALGGDSAVINLISPSTEKDAEGNLIPHDFSVGKWLHRLHDHLWDHFHGPQQKKE